MNKQQFLSDIQQIVERPDMTDEAKTQELANILKNLIYSLP